MSSSWNFPARVELSYEGSKPSKAGMNLVVHMVYLYMGAAAQGSKPYAGASEPNGWGMGQLSLLNFAFIRNRGKIHQMWFFYMTGPVYD